MHCRNKGFLLVELNLALIFIITTSLMFAGGVRQLLQGWQRIQSDIMLRRAANYSFSLPERELFLHAATVTISNTAVSYTHLDVYKRQLYSSMPGWRAQYG